MPNDEDWEDNGDPVVQVIPSEEFTEFEATHKIIKIDPQTLQSEQIDINEDSFSREIG